MTKRNGFSKKIRKGKDLNSNKKIQEMLENKIQSIQQGTIYYQEVEKNEKGTS